MANERTFTLNLPQAIACRAALLKYLKKAESMESTALDMHKGTLAQQVKDEREGLKAETVDRLSELADRVTKRKGEEIELNSVEWRAVDAGLPILVRHTRAARGTVSALCKVAMAKELEEDAKLIESQLVPMFSEQPDLPADDSAVTDAD